MKYVFRLLLFSSIVASARENPVDYRNLQKAYAQEIAQINEQYIQALKKLRTSYTKKGDLETALLIDQEIKNLSSDTLIKLTPKQRLLELAQVTTRDFTGSVADYMGRLDKSYYGKDGAIAIHPPSQATPSSIDFSSYTSSQEGKLTISVRDHALGDCIVEIVKNGETFKTKELADGKWRRITIPFDNENVVVKGMSGGGHPWYFEHLHLHVDRVTVASN